MGRRALSKDERQVKERAKRERYLSNPEHLSRARERARRREEELRQLSRLASYDRLAPLADDASRKRILRTIEVLDRIHGPEPTVIEGSNQVIHMTETGGGGDEDEDPSLGDVGDFGCNEGKVRDDMESAPYMGGCFALLIAVDIYGSQ
jgi:hypothetical protein